MLNIILTFDYELFLGKNYVEEKKVLFEPTYQIMDILDTKNIKATFFIDVCSAIRYADFGKMEFCQLMNQQLNDMCFRGFDPQLHIHPNWLKSEFKDGEWKFNVENYRLHTFNDDIETIIQNGKNYLLNVLLPNFPDYRVIAYRAGGYCLQPVSNIISILKNNGIYIDSSVAAFSYCNIKERYYDYRDMPKKPNWFIEEGDLWNKPSELQNGVFEVPVWSIHNPVFRRIINKNKTIYTRDKAKGCFIQSENHIKTNKAKNYLQYLIGRTLLSLDTLAYQQAWKSILALSNKYTNAYLAIVSHPKLYGDTALNNLACFIKDAEKYSDRVRFMTMQDIYNERIKQNVY